MKRKIIALVMIIFMSFTFIACSNNEHGLEEYKTKAKIEIGIYAEGGSYDTEKWAILLQTIKEGNAEVNTAKYKSEVDSIVRKIKTTIDDLPKEEVMGEKIGFEINSFTGIFENINEVKNTSVIIRTQEELKSFFEKYKYLSWSDNKPIWEQYEEPFFENKALIFCFWKSEIKLKSYIDEIYINGETLTFNIIASTPMMTNRQDFSTDIESQVCTIQIEVNQMDIIEVENILAAFQYLESNKMLKEFDLSDPKEFWTGNIDENFEVDKVIIIFKKTNTYPELEIEDFSFENGESIEYIWLKPSTKNPEFRQIAIMYLKRKSKEEVIKAIKELEKLEFIKNAGPSYIYDAEDD